MKYTIKEYDTRYFAGIEVVDGVKLNSDDFKRIPSVWEEFFEKHAQSIQNQVEPHHHIGLEIYPFDIKETKTFDYNVLAETKGLVSVNDHQLTRKLKPGKYICFRISFDNIHDEIQKVYAFVKQENINVHMGFDYEDYLEGQDYSKPGAVLDFCLMLEEDAE